MEIIHSGKPDALFHDLRRTAVRNTFRPACAGNSRWRSQATRLNRKFGLTADGTIALPYAVVVKKKQTGIRLSDEDLALLEGLQAELFEEGVRVTKSDIVALGLRQLKEQGGLKKVLTKRKGKKA